MQRKKTDKKSSGRCISGTTNLCVQNVHNKDNQLNSEEFSDQNNITSPK